jgi:hypothetical protein
MRVSSKVEKKEEGQERGAEGGRPKVPFESAQAQLWR